MLAIMTTQYYTASSIDGLIADSENSLSCSSNSASRAGRMSIRGSLPKFGAMAMGSTTYEWIASTPAF